jgi:hypothetical protein
MAYREKVWNPNVLTDLLSTYLTHKAGEREKYYQAELKKKPTYTQFGDELLQYDSAGNFVGVVKTKTPTTKSLDTLYPVSGTEGGPVMTRQVGSETHWINPSTNQWEPISPKVLRGYKTDVPKAGSNKIGDIRDFTVGANKIQGVYTGVITDKIGDFTGWKEGTTAPRFKPEGKAYKVGKLEEIKVGDNIVTAVYTGVDSDTVGDLVGWKQAETAPRFKADAPAHKVGDFEYFEIGNKKVKGRYTGVKTDKVGDAPGWQEVSSAPRFKEGFAVWNRTNPTTGIPEEQTLKDTERPIANEGWNLGKAGDPLSFVTWNKLNDNGTYSEVSERRGYRPTGGGWTEGQAPSASVDLTDYRTRKKEVLKMARAERDHLKDIKDQKVDFMYLRPNVPWDEDVMVPALKFYNSVLKDPDKWMKENEGLPVYGRITGEKDIVPFKFGQQQSVIK